MLNELPLSASDEKSWNRLETPEGAGAGGPLKWRPLKMEAPLNGGPMKVWDPNGISKVSPMPFPVSHAFGTRREVSENEKCDFLTSNACIHR